MKMKKKNFNTRKCIICKVNKKREDLTRITVNRNLELVIDNDNKQNKRGYYFCNTPNEYSLLIRKQSKLFKEKIETIKIKED